MKSHLVRFYGPYAKFAQPALRATGYTFDAPPPTAVVGMLENIFWKPEFSWQVLRIFVCSPIRKSTIMVNGVNKPTSLTSAYVRGDAVQRTMTVLHDVDYVVDAQIVPKFKDSARRKYDEQFERRLRDYRSFRPVVLGDRDFLGGFEPVDVVDDAMIATSISGEKTEMVPISESRFIGQVPIRYRIKSDPYPVKEFDLHPAMMMNGVIDFEEAVHG